MALIFVPFTVPTTANSNNCRQMESDVPGSLAYRIVLRVAYQPAYEKCNVQKVKRKLEVDQFCILVNFGLFWYLLSALFEILIDFS